MASPKSGHTNYKFSVTTSSDFSVTDPEFRNRNGNKNSACGEFVVSIQLMDERRGASRNSGSSRLIRRFFQLPNDQVYALRFSSPASDFDIFVGAGARPVTGRRFLTIPLSSVSLSVPLLEISTAQRSAPPSTGSCSLCRAGTMGLSTARKRIIAIE